MMGMNPVTGNASNEGRSGRGMNPVTFRDGKGNGLSIGRLHVQFGNEPVQKRVVIVMSEGVDSDRVKVLGTMTFDEEHLIGGLKKLFPNGELA
jgi:hypothetical protein